MKSLTLSVWTSASDIEGYYRDQIGPKDIRKRRANVGICAIDDQPFAPQQNLMNYGFKIDCLGDIKTVAEVAQYDIILCDIMGVGQSFDIRTQGASIMSEIRRCHPEKFIVAYTGSALNQTAARQASSVADDILKKDIDIEEWTQFLDHYCTLALNPYKVWSRIKISMADKEIDTKEILRAEDAYCRSILKGDSSFKLLTKISSDSGMREDIRAIANGLISSIAFKFMIG